MHKCTSTIIGGPCPGHLVKFDDCLTKAVWTLALMGADEATGDADFEGHLSLMLVLCGGSVLVDEDSPDERRVAVPAGDYIVYTAASGAVSLWEYASDTEARAEFAGWEARYHLWGRGCDPAKPAEHADCAEYDECQRA